VSTVGKLVSFLSSWSKGISNSIPYQLKSLVGFGQYYTVIESKEVSLTISQFHEGYFTNSKPLNTLDLEAVSRGYDGVPVLIVPDEDSITLNLSLPKSALRSLDQLLEEEIQRLTPFEVSEVNISYEIATLENSQVTVETHIVPKSKLNAISTRVKQFGLLPRIAVVDRSKLSDAENFNILGHGTDPTKTKLFFNTKVIIFFILFLTAIASPFAKLQINIDKAETISRNLRSQVTEIQLKRNKLTRLKNQSQVIRNFAQDRTAIIDLLNLVSDAVPPTAWLTRYSTSNETLTIHGFALNASQVLSELAKIKTLSSPTFQSPIIKNAADNLERFHITAKLL
jgi:general secretion pathway protein L